MSVLWNGGKIGAAFYDTFTSQVLLQLDVVETDDFGYLKRRKNKRLMQCVHAWQDVVAVK